MKTVFTEKIFFQIAGIMSMFSHKGKKIISILKKLYEIVTVISTLTIFSGLVIYIYGHIVHNNQSDNDLIMKQISEEVNGENIVAINVADIHGFGNNSIIVTTSNVEMVSYGEEHSNNLLILDITENEILHSMNDLLGTKSSYKTTFSYKIISEDIRFVPKTEYVLDIIGDSTKELIVKYYVYGSNYGANGTAIFGYSYEDSQYKIIGTYPESIKFNLHEYDNEGNYLGWKAQLIETNFYNDTDNKNNMIKCYDGEKYFNLNHGKWSGREYWIKTSSFGNVLATVNIDYYGDKTPYINVYEIMYDNEGKDLIWNLIFSEEVAEFPLVYSQDDLVKALVEIMDCQVVLIEKCNE